MQRSAVKQQDACWLGWREHNRISKERGTESWAGSNTMLSIVNAINSIKKTMMTAQRWIRFILLQAMASATEHLLAEVWAQGGVRDVYADFNELTLNITTNALFGVDMSSSQAAGISGKHPRTPQPLPVPALNQRHLRFTMGLSQSCLMVSKLSRVCRHNSTSVWTPT